SLQEGQERLLRALQVFERCFYSDLSSIHPNSPPNPTKMLLNLAHPTTTKLRSLFASPIRHLCSKADHQKRVVCEQLRSRKLIRLRGKDCLPFLQGMITNDTRHLSVDPQPSVSTSCMYAMMLNAAGRVLYDFLLYKPDPRNDDEVLLECDADARSTVLKLFNLYKLRKDVRLEPCDELGVWAAFHPFCGAVDEPLPAETPITVAGDATVNVRDPRLHLLGHRVLLDSTQDLVASNPTFQAAPQDPSESSYTRLRYQLGVSEGLGELPTANCFPLEYNADYMSGVSFHKGCYIGQELTARTHHTGVIRKRIMPVVLLDRADGGGVASDTVVKDGNDNAVGKFRVHRGQVGLALLRVDEALSAAELSVGSVRLSTVKPGWWPPVVSKRQIEGQRS
ncbi:unnamed protein product, partial [Ixodes pacificus]